jgi:hypothetical protein
MGGPSGSNPGQDQNRTHKHHSSWAAPDSRRLLVAVRVKTATARAGGVTARDTDPWRRGGR